ncbi:MAG: class I SAM-dependent methyltransferase [Chlorobiaceae bacterium]|nr:class I SAM-dependent methyltransferase [Chlorobiaceae bacterium]
MNPHQRKNLIEAGFRAAHSGMADEDAIWSLNSNDKVDIGERLAGVIRMLYKAAPLTKKMRALSLGSSSEPQFRILETVFRGGLYLMDIDQQALDIVEERIHRQYTGHVSTSRNSYLDFLDIPNFADILLSSWLKNSKVDLITLHHSLYYCPESSWLQLFEILHEKLLASRGAVHAVMMADRSSRRDTTTWLYNHFAGKFFGAKNDQSLITLKKELEESTVFKDSQIIVKTSHIKFFTDDFEKFMKVVWMILLHPDVHCYDDAQKEEIVTFVIDNFWLEKKPLLQKQHHLAVCRGFDFKVFL